MKSNQPLLSEIDIKLQTIDIKLKPLEINLEPIPEIKLNNP